MRRLAYISTLLAVWIAGMLALMLGMDSLWHPPFSPQALFAGGYWAALSAVSEDPKIRRPVATALPRRASTPLAH